MQCRESSKDVRKLWLVICCHFIIFYLSLRFVPIHPRVHLWGGQMREAFSANLERWSFAWFRLWAPGKLRACFLLRAKSTTCHIHTRTWTDCSIHTYVCTLYRKACVDVDACACMCNYIHTHSIAFMCIDSYGVVLYMVLHVDILLSLCMVPFPHPFAHNSISSQEAANHAADAGISSTCPGIVRYHGLPVPAMLSCWTPGVPREGVPMRPLGRVLEAYWSSLRLRLLACVCDSCVPRALVCVFISLVVCVCVHPSIVLFVYYLALSTSPIYPSM